MSDDINATLYLSTDQISTSRGTENISNEVGSWTEWRRGTITFNVKLRVLLGDFLYDNHDYFLLNLTQLFTQNNAAIPNGRGLILLMGGLQWVKSSYDQSKQTNGYWIPLPPIAVSSGGLAIANTIYDNKSACYLFRKSSAEETITFRFVDTRTYEIPLITDVAQMPTFKAIFKIQPFGKNIIATKK